MNVEQLIGIVAKCDSIMEEVNQDGIISYLIDDWFEIIQTENPRLVRGIVNRPHPTDKTWFVSEIVHDFGNWDTPPSSDLKDIGEYDSLEIAVFEVLKLVAEHRINSFFVEVHEDELAKFMGEEY